MNPKKNSAKKSSMHWVFAAVATLGLGTQALAQSTWTVSVLHPSGQTTSEAYGAGVQQVGYVKPSVQQTRAAMWNGSASSFVDLHPDGALTSLAWGASDGQQVGQVLFPGLGSAARASLWSGTASSRVDLNPPGWARSEAFDVAGGQQVGTAQFSSAFVASAILWTGTAESFVILDPPNAGGASRAEGTDGVQQVGFWTLPGPPSIRAALWSGTAASHVDLHPDSIGVSSRAFDVSRGQQVGVLRLPVPKPGGDSVDVASLWKGSAASWVNLNPAGAISSEAFGVLNGMQVGYARTVTGRRASLWRGTAASWVDLHAFLPPEFSTSTASDIASDGENLTISGFGFNTVNNRTEALIWRAPDPAGCDTLDPAPLDTSVEYEKIQAIFTGGPGQAAKCTTCHAPNTSAGLSLAVENSFAALVNIDSSQDPTIKRVIPFSSNGSLLFRKVNCTNPGVGSRMPLGRTPLSLDEQRLIRDWINQGAVQRQRVLVNGFE